MKIPLIIINTTTDGLGLYTPVNLTGLKLMYEVETPKGDFLLLAPEEVAPHPGCYDPYECYLKVYSHGKLSTCSICGGKNTLQINHVNKIKKLLVSFTEWLVKRLEEATEGVY